MTTEPSQSTRRSLDSRLLTLAILLSVGVLLYSVLVAQQLLLGVLTLASLLGTGLLLWLLYRLVIAVETVADSARRIANSLDEE
jgi:hypothetical protein